MSVDVMSENEKVALKECKNRLNIVTLHTEINALQYKREMVNMKNVTFVTIQQ